MENDFKKLRDKIDDAFTDDIIPGFDKEAAWNELSPRIKKKRAISVKWWAYAAAIIAIMIGLGGWLATIQTTDDAPLQVTTKPAPVIKEDVMPAPVHKEPVASPEAVVLNKAGTPIRKKTPAKQPTVENVIAGEEVKDEAVIVKDTLPVVIAKEAPEEEIIPSSLPKRRIRALHLLDIDNEDREIVINEAGELQTIQQRISFFAIPRQASENDMPAPGLKSLFKN